MSAAHLNAFCIDARERFLFAGDKSGRLWVIDPDTFTVLDTVQAHAGTIQAMAAHPTKPLFAILCKDYTVSVWTHDDHGAVRRVLWHSFRDHSPDDFAPFHSECQAIALHPLAPRLATRSGNSALIELDFEDPAAVRLTRCVRACALLDLATVAYSADGARMLVGSSGGTITVLADGAAPALHEFPDVTETMHWFEPLPDGSYLVACDARKILSFHPDRPEASRWGSVVARDDVEHVTRNPVSGRVFASSFDRNIYEIDPETLDIKRIVFRAAFKVRWIKTLRRDPDAMIVQVRDGALLRVDLATGQVVARVKHTPPALWTMASTPSGSLVVAGEGDDYWEVTAGGAGVDRAYDLRWDRSKLGAGNGTYTKRLAVQPSTGHRFFGRTDGTIWAVRSGAAERLHDAGSAIRDLAVAEHDPWLFAVTEAGEALRIHTGDGHVAARFRATEPLWSLALNEDRGFLAVGERLGRILILRASDFSEVSSTTSRLPKRARWLDGDTLLVTRSADVDRISYRAGEWTHEMGQFEGSSNTIEDFDWTVDHRYLVAISYTRLVTLFDLASRKLLDVACDGLDYMKGIMRLPAGANSSGYPHDFLTIGRLGTGKVYRIHDEQLSVIHVSRDPLRHVD